MNGVKVYIANRQNVVKVPTGIRLLVRRCCTAVLTHEKFENAAEVNVNFIDNAQIRQLNAEHRNNDNVTDVLSFPLGENGQYDINRDTGAAMLGDVVISLERAMEQAKMYGHTLQREVGFLTIHSMFHLLGYDHEKGTLEAAKMREQEEMVLSSLGLDRTASWE